MRNCFKYSKKAAGPDNISVKLLKDSADATVPFLAILFNLSLSQGVFPMIGKSDEFHRFINQEKKTNLPCRMFPVGTCSKCPKYSAEGLLILIQ